MSLSRALHVKSVDRGDVENVRPYHLLKVSTKIFMSFLSAADGHFPPNVKAFGRGSQTSTKAASALENGKESSPASVFKIKQTTSRESILDHIRSMVYLRPIHVATSK